MSRSKNQNVPILTDDAGIATAGAIKHAGVSASAPLTLVRPSTPVFNKNLRARSTSAKSVAYQEQYKHAIAMSSAELGKSIKDPTKRITKHLGQAMALEKKAKTARNQAQAEFNEHIGFYYEAKQRLLNPGYRTNVDGGKDRTPDENQKNFGAPDWATFVETCKAYSLQHTDRLLKQYAKSNGLLTDDGENIDDPETEEVESARPSRRSTNDITAQKWYEHVATAAMSIASSNPEGEVEKQILAAAEYIPAPMTPLQPDIYTEVLSFVTMIAKLAPTESVKADAKKLLGKLLLLRLAPDPAKILAEATAEEKRKRDGRLAKKNRQLLGNAVGNPSTRLTSEHVQRLTLGPDAGAGVIQAVCSSSPEPSPEPPAKVPACDEEPASARRLDADPALAAPVGAQRLEVGQKHNARSAKANAAPAQNLVDDNSTAPLAHSAAQTLRPPATMMWAELVREKKYQVRPAPSGGYGVYEPRSTVLLQWYEEEDDARDAIDSVIAIALCA